MNSVCGRMPPALDVEFSAYNRFAQRDDKTLLPSRFNSGSDCWILATLTSNLCQTNYKLVSVSKGYT